ncbi:MAG: hypothetical protein U0798_00065 [Gemmataceae bacterium]
MSIIVDTMDPTTSDFKSDHLYDLIFRLRNRLLNPKPNEPSILAKFGWMVIDHLGLVSSEILPAHGSADAVQAKFENVARRYLDAVLPDPNDLTKFDSLHVAELIAAINPDQPDPGRITAAFGLAHMDEFGKDPRLVSRVGAYRGKRGFPLTDYLIAKITSSTQAEASR